MGNPLIKSKGPGFWNGFTNYFKLIARLMADSRVSPLLKLLPVGTLIYLVVPTDLMPLLPIDDAAIIWLGTYFFIELCPPEVVEEHRAALNMLSQGDPGTVKGNNEPSGEIVDAEYWEADEDDK
jgi:hypothetical protein